MGFNPYRDFISGLILSSLIPEDKWSTLPQIKKANVVGPYHFNGIIEGFTIVADSALRTYTGRRDMIVTDLDGPMEIILGDKNAIKVVHAHGDNIQRIGDLVPRLKGTVLGTTQSIPHGTVRNIGGFTDGDRSIIMAKLMGAVEVEVFGFNFEDPVDEPVDRKLLKLEIAKEIIEELKNIRLTYH